MRGGCWALAGSVSIAQSTSTIEKRVFRGASWIESVNRLVCGVSVRFAGQGSKYTTGYASKEVGDSSILDKAVCDRAARLEYTRANSNCNFAPRGQSQPPTLILENEITTRPLVGSPKLVAGRNWVKIRAFFISGLSSFCPAGFNTR